MSDQISFKMTITIPVTNIETITPRALINLSFLMKIKKSNRFGIRHKLNNRGAAPISLSSLRYPAREYEPFLRNRTRRKLRTGKIIPEISPKESEFRSFLLHISEKVRKYQC